MIADALCKILDELDTPSSYEVTVYLGETPMGQPQRMLWGDADSVEIVTDERGLGSPSLVIRRDGDTSIVPERAVMYVEVSELSRRA